MSVAESVPLNIAKRLLHKGRTGDKKNIKNDLSDPSAQILDNHENKVTNEVPQEEGGRSKKTAATPAFVKRQQVMKNSEWYNSPTDNFLSPCSQRLWKPKKDTIAPMRLKLDDSPSKGTVTEVFEDENMDDDRPANCLETSMEELNCSSTS